MPVIDADGHVMEPRDFWDRYMEPAYYERRPRVIRENTGTERLMIDGVLFPPVRGKGAGNPRGLVFDQRPAGASDPQARLKDMDLEGIDIAVLFPTQMLCLGGATDPGLAQAMTRAYNNWLADFCRAAPDRLKGVATLSLLDVPAAIEELKRTIRDHGFIGGWVSPNVAGKDLDHPDFLPFYAEVEKLGVPLLIHPGPALGTPAAGVERFENFFYVHSIGFPFEAMIATMTLVCGGVLERFPKLRVGILESGVGWLPYWMERLDEHYEMRPQEVPLLTKKPSEYIRSGQFFISCDPGEEMVPYVLDEVGADRVVFASDYSHWDSKCPEAVEAFRQTKGLRPDLAARVLSDNAIALFGERILASAPVG